MPMPVYMRRYTYRLFGFLSGYMGALVGGLMSVRNGASTPLRVTIAVVTASMICGVFWAIFRLLVECDDEYQRHLMVRQILLATAAMLTVTTLWQFLAVFDVIAEGPQWIGVIWFAMLGLAAPVARWRA